MHLLAKPHDGDGEGANKSRALKTTRDGKTILAPQPDDSANDPLNWSIWQRNATLATLGVYCMLGGGAGIVLAAGFDEVAHTFHVAHEAIALTTGIYMLGLGLGALLVSPTAIIYGKRPVYITSALLFLGTCIFCAKAPSYIAMLVARFIQGIAVSPIEALPSATISEIFFLHERAFRLGLYVLLLLTGKNLIPLAGAAIIGSDGWRWVFWTYAIAVACSATAMYFFLPESYWNRKLPGATAQIDTTESRKEGSDEIADDQVSYRRHSRAESQKSEDMEKQEPHQKIVSDQRNGSKENHVHDASLTNGFSKETNGANDRPAKIDPVEPEGVVPQRPTVATTKSHAEQQTTEQSLSYTERWRLAPKKSPAKMWKLYNGRLSDESWFVVAVRPFVLYSYPAVLWSALLYSLSIGWLIVLSESVGEMYQGRQHYNFTSLQVGLVYISPFVGAVIGTALAGKLSDFVVKFMARRNGGIYEPEFRLLMVPLIAISTVIGLMGFGWSAEQRDNWAIPTVFFGIISFGCSLGSSTAITFCVDSYKDYAGEALVTLNFSKSE